MSSCLEPQQSAPADTPAAAKTPAAAAADAPTTKQQTEELPAEAAASTTNGTANSKHQKSSRFKEKRRPVPLNLPPHSGNQEIPLDLSVKSAGNVPSGALDGIFGCLAGLSRASGGDAPAQHQAQLLRHLSATQAASSTSQAPLETPRIAWQDNDVNLLIKPRLLSSSSTSANTSASQRLRLASLIGDSPPATPSSPSLELLYSLNGHQPPHQLAASQLPLSASCLLAGPSSAAQFSFPSASPAFLSSGRLRPFARHQEQPALLSAAGRQLTPDELSETISRLSSRRLAQVAAAGAAGARVGSPSRPIQRQRRSCSSENLTDDAAKFLQVTDADKSKAKVVSPLASNNFTSGDLKSSPGAGQPANRFSFPNSQLYLSSDSSRSTSSPQSRSQDKRSPTGVTNATSNLLNIRLNSPVGEHELSAQSPAASSPTARVARTESQRQSYQDNQHASDPLLSAAFCQQADRLSSAGSVSSAFASSSNSSQHHFYQQPAALATSGSQNGLQSSLSSSATLNTPTLISPSQLRTGPLCFVPSPTLSPMSSVFELPSPLLMFPPSSQQQPVAAGETDEQPAAKLSASDTGLDASCRTSKVGASPAHRSQSQVSVSAGGQQRSESLAHLITCAADKMNDVSGHNEDVHMDDASSDLEGVGDEAAKSQRPATVIPRILVSGCLQQRRQQPSRADVPMQWQSTGAESSLTASQSVQSVRSCSGYAAAESQGRIGQRDSAAKRALSPRSFRDRVSAYHGERLESSSAPPDVFHRLVRPKVKSAVRDPSVGAASFGHLRQVAGEIENQHNSWQRQSQPQVALNRSAGQLNADQGAGHLQQAANFSSGSSSHHFSQKSAPYPDVRGWQSRSLVHGMRSSSADPHQLYPEQHRAAPQPAQLQQPHYSAPQHQRQPLAQLAPSSSSLVNASYLHNASYGHSSYNLSQSAHQLHQPELAAHHYQSAGGGHSLVSAQFVDQVQSQSAGELHRAAAFSQQPHAYSHQIGQQANQQYQQYQQQQQQQPIVYQSGELDGLFHAGQPARAAPAAYAAGNQELYLRALSADQGSGLRGESPGSSSNSQEPTSYAASDGKQLGGGGRSRSALLSGSAALGAPVSVKRYHCEQCSKAFTRSDMLTRHGRLHSGDRPFQCNECKQEFSRSDHLSTHMRTHTGEKPYKCKVCTYSACRKDMITRHMKVHNRSSPTPSATSAGLQANPSQV